MSGGSIGYAMGALIGHMLLFDITIVTDGSRVVELLGFKQPYLHCLMALHNSSEN